MVRNYYRLLIVILCFLMGLQVWGLLSTSGLNWGFHFLGLLPIHFKIFYFAVAIAAIVYFSRKPELKFLDRIQHFMVNKPYYFITLIIIGFIICAVTLRVRVPLLGDGFYIVKNFSEALRGAAPLDLRNEPLSTVYFFWISKILNVSSYNGLLNAFLIADTILGIVFIIAIFYLTRSIFTEPQEQLLSFLFLLSVPYLQLFFGYVETYSGVLLLLTLYLLTALLYLKQKLPFTSAAVTFLVMFFSHYLSLLLLPSLIYLSIREKKVNGTKNIVKAIGMMAVIILIVLVMINFDVEKFYAWVPHSHFLPLSFSTEPVERYSEPYTLFSFFHGVDIFNYIILMASGAVCFLLLTYFRSRTVFRQSIESKFLILASFPVLILLFILKFDLGMAKDWDILSPYFISIAIYAIFIFFQSKIADSRYIVLPILVIMGYHTFSYLFLNGRTVSSIDRYKKILDSRLLSNQGLYSSTLSLALYYHQINDVAGPVEVWERYSKEFPLDGQGYRNTITNLNNLGLQGIGKIVETYERWLKAIPQDTLAVAEYSAYCLDAGNFMFTNGVLHEAKMFYSKVILLTPLYERGYNNLGSVYAQEGKSDTAIFFFQKAIELSPEYSDPYYNLGTIYEDQGNRKKALELFKQSAQLKNTAAIEKLKEYSSKR